jgi:Fe-S-cluster formation regulator IscX/YfhJ
LSLAHFDKDIDPNRNVKRGEMKQEICELNEKKKNQNECKLLSVANKLWHSWLPLLSIKP